MAEDNNSSTTSASREERKKLLRCKRQVSFQQGDDLIPLDLITEPLHKSTHRPDGRVPSIRIVHKKSKKKKHLSRSLDPVSLSHFCLLLHHTNKWEVVQLQSGYFVSRSV